MGIEDLIPKVSGFAPLPLSIMAPFMAYQSAQMGFAFGFDYEKGKRSLKSMSNEEFNNLTTEQEQGIFAHNHGVLLQTFINEIPKSDIVQKIVLDKLVELEFKKVDMNIRLFKELPSEYLKQLLEVFGAGGDTNNIQGLIDFFNNLASGTTTVHTDPIPTPTPTLTAPTLAPSTTIDASSQDHQNLHSEINRIAEIVKLKQEQYTALNTDSSKQSEIDYSNNTIKPILDTARIKFTQLMRKHFDDFNYWYTPDIAK